MLSFDVLGQWKSSRSLQDITVAIPEKKIFISKLLVPEHQDHCIPYDLQRKGMNCYVNVSITIIKGV